MNKILIDIEDVEKLTDEQRLALEECMFWQLGDFSLLGVSSGQNKKEPWLQAWLDKQNEGDRFPIDYQGYDDEEANARHGIT